MVMTIKSFITEIQEYYGVYENKHLGASVMAYLNHDIDNAKLPTLMKYIKYNHKYAFGAPCIASIEECIDKAIKNKKGADVRKLNNNEKEEITKNREELVKFKQTLENVPNEITSMFNDKIKEQKGDKQ